MRAPFFTSPLIRNHASVIAKYARMANKGELTLIPNVSYLDFITVEMNGTSSSSNRAPKIKTGGIFICIVLYTKNFYPVPFTGCG
jgi:hypothetical protein